MGSWFSEHLLLTFVIFLAVLAPHPAAAQLPPVAVQPREVLGEDPDHARLEIGAAPQVRSILQQDAQYRVRVVYAVPNNRTPQPDAEATLQAFVRDVQAWFADNMELAGYGRKTFVYETAADSDAPLIYQVELGQPDTYFHGGYLQRWDRVLSQLAFQFPVFQAGDVLLVVSEMHVQEADGRLNEASNFVGGAGSSVSGVAMVTGEAIAILGSRSLADERLYGGIVLPGFGPYPLVQDYTFAWYDGRTLSSISSTAFGGFAHELGHAFGLWHDFRNESILLNGNVMGNGFRGIRGALLPELFPHDDARLSPANALILEYSRFFNTEQTFTDDSAPFVQFRTSGTAVPEHGLCNLPFVAEDMGSGLAGAVLTRAGHVVAERPLSGPEFEGAIGAYDYQPGVADEWQLVVLDREGNRTTTSVTTTCAAGHNRAPVPFTSVSDTRLEIGEQTVLDARSSSDPDGSYTALAAQWDLDGDGDFDTEPSTAKYFQTMYAKPGIYRVTARLIDDEGDSSVSNPIAIRVGKRELEVDIDVKPDDARNVINPFAEGGLWVAVLSDAAFDPLQIDVSTVRFGAGGARVLRHQVRDVNGDGSSDLLLRFRIPDIGIRCGDQRVRLEGETFVHEAVFGSDSIETTGCKKKH